MQDDQQTSQQKTLSKTELGELFDKIFVQEANTSCFECGKKSKQWAQKKHAIFLCLNCAAQYKELTWAIEIKSITLDMWTKDELASLARGGNLRFKKYIEYYELGQLDYKEKLKTKAAQQYRIMLKQQAKGHQAPPQIPIDQGKQPYNPETKLSDLTVDQMLTATKEKAFWLGSKTKQYGGIALDKSKQLGGIAYTKVHHKVTSGELKTDAKEVANKISTNTKYFWGKLVQKFQEVTGDKKPGVNSDSALQNKQQKQPSL